MVLIGTFVECTAHALKKTDTTDLEYQLSGATPLDATNALQAVQNAITISIRTE